MTLAQTSGSECPPRHSIRSYHAQELSVQNLEDFQRVADSLHTRRRQKKCKVDTGKCAKENKIKRKNIPEPSLGAQDHRVPFTDLLRLSLQRRDRQIQLRVRQPDALSRGVDLS